MFRGRFILVLAAAALVMAVPGVAPLGDGTAAAQMAQAGRVPVPKPAKGKGDKCVADTDFMRRNHMDMLDHKRDATVHEGIRTKRFALKECIDCHAVEGSDGKPVTVKDPKHFCRSCHDYAAVRVDCFQCHASRPAADAAAGKQSSAGQEAAEIARLAAYLREVQR